MASTLIVELLETAAKPGVLGMVGRRQERIAAADLAVYFLRLGKQLDAADIGSLASQPKDLALHALDLKISNILRKESTALLSVLAVNIQAAYLAGSRQEVEGKEKIVAAQREKNQLSKLSEADVRVNQSELDKLGPSGEAAAQYAARRAAKLVTDINKTTREIIRDTISEGIEERLGVPGTARLLRSRIKDMSSTRAQMIATTEMNDAMSQAALDKIGRLLEYKQLILSDDACEICIDNADADPLPVAAVYPSGDSRPPFHPNCRCAITGARAPEGEGA
jgi:hypothetical protein